ncbi:hypothetical protein C8R47DRAFT_1227761 [Mycena vitilis]|nr:hypothetical protein C8R47DRAFT_1227761 [Mycena vitilis]
MPQARFDRSKVHERCRRKAKEQARAQPRAPKVRCPLCHKAFSRPEDVRNHLNQPNGKCHASFHSSIQKAAKDVEQRLAEIDQDTMEVDDDEDGDSFDFPMDGAEDMEEYTDDTPPNSGLRKTLYAGAAQTFGRGKTFMDKFHEDKYAPERRDNLYHPFASRHEWQLVSFIIRWKMTVAQVDEFLKLPLVARMHLSFSSCKELRSRVETMPRGPSWLYKVWKPEYPTSKPLTVFYRDPLECLRALLENPLLKDHIQYSPFTLWRTAGRVVRVYTEWLSGDVAAKMQGKLPPGATVLGTILSTDKTQLSRMTGNRSAYPGLIGSANIDMDFRMKASHHAFSLFILVPIAKFLEKDPEIRGMLSNRLFHAIMDFVLTSVKKAAEVGVMMDDPTGWTRWCFTPLAADIVDTPESGLIACTAGNASSVTTATYKQFGDDFRHEPRTRNHTIKQLLDIENMGINAWDLKKYVTEAKKRGLNGVHRPFWENWPLAEPSTFLTPEMLHHWFKFFFDHVVKWSIAVLGEREIDFRFQVLRGHTNMRHFDHGISKAKQVTGKEHRDMMRYLLLIIAGAKGVSADFVIAVRNLIDFIYDGQAPLIDDDILDRMSKCLAGFHEHKEAIMEAGARRGKKGPIEHWNIPKLEFMQSVIPAIKANGVPRQWTADVTERAHITEVKVWADKTNHQDYEAQICRHLDRRDKCRLFELATAMDSAGVDLGAAALADLDPDDNGPLRLTRTSELLEHIELVGLSNLRPRMNYFSTSLALIEGRNPNALLPYRTFTSADNSTAFQLKRDHHGRRLTVEDAARTFKLPDLQDAVRAYFQCPNHGSKIRIGGRRPNSADLDYPLQLKVWHDARIQSRSYHDENQILEPQTIVASPPEPKWPFGQGEPVIVNADSEYHWPQSGLQGHTVCQLKLIFQAVAPTLRNQPAGADRFLAYVERFDVVNQTNAATNQSGPFPERSTDCYLLERATRAGNSKPMGDVIPLDRLRSMVDLVPKFGRAADPRLTEQNCLDYCGQFWLNRWHTKELYWALSGK